MIKIINKQDCCGCEACVSVCPKNCISMKRDAEGFLYPIVNEEICINCGLCEKNCPCLNRKPKDKIDDSYTFLCMRNTKEQDLMKSSSGSIFALLAKEIIKENGIVFGAKWNKEWGVEHGFSESDISEFQGSKYLQSEIKDTYKQVQKFLKMGRPVLFSGVPCQILGLKSFLQKDYENLLCVDILCHAVVSPKVWQYYLDGKLHIDKKSKDDIVNINFRKKGKYPNGSPTTTIFSIEYKDKIVEEQLYLQPYGIAFSIGIANRQSCSKCPCENLSSNSDITLGDFWGATSFYKDLNPNKGLSLVISKTRKGHAFIEKIKKYCEFNRVLKKEECLQNGGLTWKSRNLHPKREMFFFKLENAKDSDKIKVIKKFTRLGYVKIIKLKLKSILRKVLFRK